MVESEFRLMPSERMELKERMRSRTLPAEDVRRARLILLLAQGQSWPYPNEVTRLEVSTCRKEGGYGAGTIP